MTALITLAVGLAAGVPLGAWLRRALLCTPACQKDGVWLWTPEQEVAAWERGVTVGDAHGRGELSGRTAVRVRGVLAGRRARVDEPDRSVAA